MYCAIYGRDRLAISPVINVDRYVLKNYLPAMLMVLVTSVKFNERFVSACSTNILGGGFF